MVWTLALREHLSITCYSPHPGIVVMSEHNIGHLALDGRGWQQDMSYTHAQNPGEKNTKDMGGVSPSYPEEGV